MKQNIRDIVIVLLGNTLYALAISAFILPGGLIMGGTTGIALVLNHFLNISVSDFVLVFNITMYVIGFILLGKKFAYTTLISSFYYPIALKFFEFIFKGQGLTQDILLNTIFGGILIGIAIGMVLAVGASTGGMDIPSLILNKYYRIPISLSIYVFDFVILALQFSFNPGDTLLYGIILIIIYTLVMDMTMLRGSQSVEIKVLSDMQDIIKQKILKDLDRGVTVIDCEGGYSGQPKQLLLSVMNTRELARVERAIHDLDPHAFIIVSKVSEVRGRGFSKEKQYQ